MSIEQLQQDLESNFKMMSKPKGELHNFEILFKLYTQAESQQTIKATGESTKELSALAGQAQDELINLSARLTSQTMEDLLFKMAMWRRYAAQIDPFDPEMTGDEKLGYSIFKDLVIMCQRDDVLTERDRQYVSNH